MTSPWTGPEGTTLPPEVDPGPLVFENVPREVAGESVEQRRRREVSILFRLSLSTIPTLVFFVALKQIAVICDAKHLIGFVLVIATIWCVVRFAAMEAFDNRKAAWPVVLLLLLCLGFNYFHAQVQRTIETWIAPLAFAGLVTYFAMRAPIRDYVRATARKKSLPGLDLIKGDRVFSGMILIAIGMSLIAPTVIDLFFAGLATDLSPSYLFRPAFRPLWYLVGTMLSLFFLALVTEDAAASLGKCAIDKRVNPKSADPLLFWLGYNRKAIQAAGLFQLDPVWRDPVARDSYIKCLLLLFSVAVASAVPVVDGPGLESSLLDASANFGVRYQRAFFDVYGSVIVVSILALPLPTLLFLGVCRVAAAATVPTYMENDK